jgi:hypothetical protein
MRKIVLAALLGTTFMGGVPARLEAATWPSAASVVTLPRLTPALSTGVSLDDGAYDDCDNEEECGKQRWLIKTTADDEARFIDQQPIDTTIYTLGCLPRPQGLKRNSERMGAEFNVYVVAAVLVTYFSEADGDLHLVLSDGDDRYMVAEIPSPECVETYAVYHDAIHAVREHFLHHFGNQKSKRTVNESVTVYGVAFFDACHNVSKAAPNLLELHPVIAIKFANE